MSSSAKTWHPDPQQLTAFAQGRLPPAESKKLQAHLDQCAACRQELAKLPAGGESLSGHETLPPVGLAKVAASPPLVTTPTHRPGSDVPADLVDHPRYEILQLLGQGGMGAVYKARHKKMNRLVALKVINAQLVGSDKAVERFHREVEAAAKLHHANIVTAHDADQAGSTHFLVMEFVEGSDLAKYVEKKGPLPVAHACHFIRQAALGLQHAHEHGMVHRDIKPHNLMLASPVASAPGVLTVKVMDFGLARLAREEARGAGLTGDNVLMGTADYIAPEQAEDAHKADIRADIYSLGCSLYHLLAGKAPFAGGTVVQKIMAHATAAAPLAELSATVPGELRTVLAKMMEKNPASRYQTPGEVAQALAPFVKKAAGMKPPPIPPSVSPADARDERTISDDPAKPKRVRKRERRWPVPVWIGVSVAALLLVVSVVYLASGRGRSPVDPLQGPVSGDPPQQKQPEALPPTFKNSLGMEFVLVPKGEFRMGGGGGTIGPKEVTIGHDFYLGKYEVTQEEWEKVTGINPSSFKIVAGVAKEDQKRFPVESVSWDDARLFLDALNQREKESGWLYRLPKEAEWEYACRGGPTSNKFDYAFDFYFDKPAKELLADQANFEHGKGLKRPCKVGSYNPNRLGLYDMHGNVWEWCADEDKAADGTSRRVYRGGSWFDVFGFCRAAWREANVPSSRNNSLGVRVARVPIGKEPVAAPPPKPPEPVKPVGALPATCKNSLGMEFVLVPKGKSWHGGGGGKPGAKEVEIAQDFYLGKYEVTQEEWEKVMGQNPSYFSRKGNGQDAVKGVGDDELKRFPVEQVSWDDAQRFLREVNERVKDAGWVNRLPTEEEWEYACREGPASSVSRCGFDFYLKGASSRLLPEEANFGHGKHLDRTCKVGSYRPNGLGLHDMHGNLWEMCDTEQKGADGALLIVGRGGFWGFDSSFCRAAARSESSRTYQARFLGLRLARVPVGREGK